MKNINYVINGVLAVAVVILFIMQFSDKKESTVTKTFASGEGDSINLLPIAYVNVDSLLLNYNYFKDLNEQLLKKRKIHVLTLPSRHVTCKPKYRNSIVKWKIMHSLPVKELSRNRNA